MGPFSVCGSGGFSRIDTVPTETYTEGEMLPRSNHAEDVDAAQVASEHDRIFRYPLSSRPLSPSRFYLPISLPPSLFHPLPSPTRFFPWAIYTNCYSPRMCLDTSGCLLCQECFLYPAHDLVGGEVGGQSETSDGKHETEINRTSSHQSCLAVWGLKLCGGRER